MKHPGQLPKICSFFSLLTLLSVSGCNKSAMDCLPYEGKVVGWVPCGGTLIQVTNKQVNSKYNDGRRELTNVLGGAVFDGTPDSSIVKLNSTVYFDIRELTPDETLICLAIFAMPTRRVGITRISKERCSIVNQ